MSFIILHLSFVILAGFSLDNQSIYYYIFNMFLYLACQIVIIARSAAKVVDRWERSTGTVLARLLSGEMRWFDGRSG